MRKAAKKQRKIKSASNEIRHSVIKPWHEAVPGDRMGHLVKDASRAFMRALQLQLAGHGVQVGHWAFFRILWEKDGLTQQELSLAAGVMAPTALGALRAMEAMGYVKRRRSAGNQKNVFVFLTPAGKDLRKKLVPLAERINDVALAGLAQKEINAIRGALISMIENLLRYDARHALPSRDVPII